MIYTHVLNRDARGVELLSIGDRDVYARGVRNDPRECVTLLARFGCDHRVYRADHSQ